MLLLALARDFFDLAVIAIGEPPGQSKVSNFDMVVLAQEQISAGIF